MSQTDTQQVTTNQNKLQLAKRKIHNKPEQTKLSRNEPKWATMTYNGLQWATISQNMLLYWEKLCRGKVRKLWSGEENVPQWKVFPTEYFYPTLSDYWNLRGKLTKSRYFFSLNALFNALILRWLLIRVGIKTWLTVNNLLKFKGGPSFPKGC